MGIKTMMYEIGEEIGIKMFGDSSAAQGTVARQGIGKSKHLSVKQLWLQAKVADGTIDARKIPRTVNVSDALTHGWTAADIRHFYGMSLRAETQPHKRHLRGGA